MRLLLYNIRYGAGIGRRIHLPLPYAGYLKKTGRNLEQIAAFIRDAAPDIAGLIEVDSGSFRSGKSNQAATIAREMQHYYIYQSKYARNSLIQKIPVLNKQGNAFLTNQEIQSIRYHYFNEGIKRLVIELELKEIKLFLVHLSLKFRHRQQQLRDLYSVIQNEPKPYVVAGDFNPLRGERELLEFIAATGLKSANDSGMPSHPSRCPRRQLDFILYSPEIHTRNFQVPQVKFSDHVPLIWDFEVTQCPGRSKKPVVLMPAFN